MRKPKLLTLTADGTITTSIYDSNGALIQAYVNEIAKINYADHDKTVVRAILKHGTTMTFDGKTKLITLK